MLLYLSFYAYLKLSLTQPSTMMRKHIDMVAYLHIAYGFLILLTAFIVFIGVAGGGWLSGETEAIFITTGIGLGIGLFLTMLALPSFIGGYGLLKRKEWARILIIIISFLDLFSFPFGTALGIYSLWVLFKDEVQAEFSNTKVYPR